MCDSGMGVRGGQRALRRARRAPRDTRDVTYEPYGKTNDDTTGQVTMAVIPILERRRSHSKQESLTA